jgi:hypothetical protein
VPIDLKQDAGIAAKAEIRIFILQQTVADVRIDVLDRYLGSQLCPLHRSRRRATAKAAHGTRSPGSG